MANGKKSFVLYADYIQIFTQLTNDEAGCLIKHLFSYVNDEEPELNDRLLKILFEPIKQQLKRDLKKWEHKREKLSEAGKASAEKRKAEQMSTNVEQPQQAEVDPTVNVTATVTATVNNTESTAHANLKDSNLYSQPVIPTKQQVLEAIVNAGGNKQMAKSFYEKHDSTGWFIQGSPIKNYVSLANKFVDSWKRNDKKEEPKTTSTPLSTLHD